MSRVAANATRALCGMVVLIAVLFPTAGIVLGLKDMNWCESSHHFSRTQRAGFEPPEFLDVMEPGHRLATTVKSSLVSDLKVVYGHILGSAGYSPILDRGFTTALEGRGLINHDSPLNGYHFTLPLDIKASRRLGIRYVMSHGEAPSLRAAGWAEIARGDTTQVLTWVVSWVLYEDPTRPTPFYLNDSEGGNAATVRTYRFTGNAIEVTLPPIDRPMHLTAAFAIKPGWRARVDGRERPIEADEYRLMRVAIAPGDSTVILRYGSTTWWSVAACFLAGLGLAALAAGLLAGRDPAGTLGRSR